MGVYYESTSFGDIRATAVHGRPGVGVCELAIGIAWLIQPTRSEVLSIFGTSAWISVQVAGTDQISFLGQALPETTWCTETRDHALEQELLYRLVLPHAQFLGLEDLRRGQDLVLHIDMRGNSHGPRGIRTFDHKMMLRVTVSDWIRVLRDAKVADVLLVGVQMPAGTDDGRFKASIDLVRKANDHLILGHYSAAVAECRLAIESLWRAASLTDRARDARKQLANLAAQKGLSKFARELALGEALRIFCHTAHHVRDDALPEEFGRLDAALAVGTTAALVSSLVAAPSRLEADVVAEVQKASISSSAVAATVESGNSQLGERVGKAVAHFRKNSANRPGSNGALKSALESLFANKLEPREIEAIIRRLKSDGVIKVSGRKLEYQLPVESR